MTDHWLDRTELLVGRQGVERLRQCHVLVVGLGGVGAYSAELIARSGVGEMTIVDADTVENSNRNRQLPALTTTVGQAKVDVVAERLRQINPGLKLHALRQFVRDQATEELLDSARFDYVVDAIDSLSPKCFLIRAALRREIKIISAMGAGGKMDPARVAVADIQKTYQCKLAHALRKRLHRLGIQSGFKAVFSPEAVPETAVRIEEERSINKLSVVGTISYMPALFGCLAAAEVIRDLLQQPQEP